MAVSAKFLADFSDFTRAVDKAELKLTEFRTESGRVERALRQMGDSFSGKKILSEAQLAVRAVEDLGGASKLTSNEQARLNATITEALAKYRALGIEAPKSMTDLAAATKQPAKEVSGLTSLISKLGPIIATTFSVTAIIGFAKGIGEFAGKMADLSAQTGISTTRLQALNFVGVQTGLSIDQITDSIGMLSRRLVEGDKSAVGAVEKLNLSVHSLIAMRPDQAFIEIGKAVAGIENPMQRVHALTELFGRSGAQMGRIMTRDMEQVIDAAEKTGAVIDEELIKKADQWADAWDRAKLRVQGVLASIFLGPSMEAQRKQVQQLLEFQAKGGKLRPEQIEQMNRLLSEINQADVLKQAGALRPTTAFGPAGTGGGLIQPRSAEEFLKQADKATAATLRTVEASKKLLETQNWWVLFKSTATNSVEAVTDSLEGDLIPALQMSTEKLSGLMRAVPGGISSQGISGGVGPASKQGFFGNLFGDVSGGLKKMFEGMTGGAGIGGMLSKIGSGLIGNLFSGGLNSLVSAGISGIGKLFGKLFGGEGKKVNDMRDQFVGAAGGIEELNKQAVAAGTSLDKLLGAKKVKDFEAEMQRLNEVLGNFASDQEADAQRLTAAIQKYGFEFEQLGPALQRQKLDEQAKELIEDWRVLVGAGVDLGLVNEKMTGAINEYLQMALRVGSEVPAAMRPILEKMLQQGLLTDEAGNAITDLEAAGISFSETMTQGFDKVVKKLDELIAKLVAAGTAMGNIPSVPSFPPAELTPLPGDIPFAAQGGRVRRSGLAVIHQDEFVVPSNRRGGVDVAGVVAAIQSLGAQLIAQNLALPDQIQAAVTIGRAR